ncbi:hypothetical protein N0V90_012416 [Kalmusia sp. IMI 367209]|nr:hypothetical protein N0V90_012416 [Kalmusia sp. IMI 367209]
MAISKSSPLVENTILTISACHLRHISPGTLQHRIAEHFQQSQVLHGLRNTLQTPTKHLGQSGVNAAMLSALLLNMIAFALPEFQAATSVDPQTSWVFSNDDNRLGWLDLQVALRPLLHSMDLYIDNTLSLLGPVFFGGMKESWEFMKMFHAFDLIPQSWKEFFEIRDIVSGCDCRSPQIGEIFRAPVTILIQLRDLEPMPSNIYKTIQFLAKVQRPYRALLLKNDERALWLFGYWLGVLCRFKNIWWCEKRARRDYTAILVWLRQRDLTKRPGHEGLLWKEKMAELQCVSF